MGSGTFDWFSLFLGKRQYYPGTYMWECICANTMVMYRAQGKDGVISPYRMSRGIDIDGHCIRLWYLYELS